MAGIDWAASGLRQRWWVDLLDLQGNVTGTLDGVTAMSVSWKAGAPVRGSGTLTVTPRANLDLLGAMARIWVETSDPAGNTHKAPILTGHLEADEDAETAAGSTVTIQVRDPTARLDPQLGTGLWADIGDNVTALLRDYLSRVQITAPALTDTAETLRTPLIWTADKTWREVVTTLADTAGLSAAWSDEWGTIHLDPYVLPRDRPILHEWGHGPRSTQLAAYTVARNTSSIPNHLTRVSKSEPDVYPLVSEIWDTDPASPWSTVSRGRTVADVEVGVDAASQAVLDARAAQDWAKARRLTRKFVVGRRWQPARLGDRVRYRTAPRPRGDAALDGYDTTATLQGYEIRATAGHPLETAQATLEEVTL